MCQCGQGLGHGHSAHSVCSHTPFKGVMGALHRALTGMALRGRTWCAPPSCSVPLRVGVPSAPTMHSEASVGRFLQLTLQVLRVTRAADAAGTSHEHPLPQPHGLRPLLNTSGEKPLCWVSQQECVMAPPAWRRHASVEPLGVLVPPVLGPGRDPHVCGRLPHPHRAPSGAAPRRAFTRGPELHQRPRRPRAAGALPPGHHPHS